MRSYLNRFINWIDMRPEKRNKRKVRILKASEDFFLTEGFNATSMKQIADKADLAVGTLYNYFKSKNDILLAIMEDEMNTVITEFPEYDIHDDPESVTAAYLNLITEMFMKFGTNVWKEVFGALLSSDDHMSKGYSLDMQLIAEITEVLTFFKENGKIRDTIDAAESAYLLYGTVMLSFISGLFIPGFDIAAMKHMITSQVSLIFNGLKAD